MRKVQHIRRGFRGPVELLHDHAQLRPDAYQGAVEHDGKKGFEDQRLQGQNLHAERIKIAGKLQNGKRKVSFVSSFVVRVSYFVFRIVLITF